MSARRHAAYIGGVIGVGFILNIGLMVLLQAFGG